MAEADGAQHDFLGQLMGFRVDHQHAFLRTGEHQVQLGGGDLFLQRVQDVFAILVANARRTDRAHEGHAGEGQRRGSTDHRDDIGVILEIVAENGTDDLRLVAVGGVKQRADRTVDQSGGQNLLLRRPALALEEAAGDLARGESLFLIIHGEREEVLPFLRRLGADGGAQHRCLAIGGHHGAMRLTRDLASLQGQRAPTPVDLFTVNGKHTDISSSCGTRASGQKSS